MTHIKALRLSWITRVIGEREGPWKSYLLFHLKKYGGVFLLKCNYDVNDLNLKLSGFYSEMLQWWVEVRNHFADINFSRYIIWNNKDIRIPYKPVFYKTYLERGTFSLKDLEFEKDNVHSFEFQKSEGLNTNFLTWTALRSSIPKERLSSLPRAEFDPMVFKNNGKDFVVYSARCKQFYSVLISGKVKEPSSFKKMVADCDISTSVQDVYKIPYTVASETYVWSFQFKILNRILFTKAKLFKIGLKKSGKCSFCNTHEEGLYYLFFNCSYAQEFRRSFIAWWW